MFITYSSLKDWSDSKVLNTGNWSNWSKSKQVNGIKNQEICRKFEKFGFKDPKRVTLRDNVVGLGEPYPAK